MKTILKGLIFVVALAEAFFGGVIAMWYISLQAISESAAKRRRRTVEYPYYKKAN